MKKLSRNLWVVLSVITFAWLFMHTSSYVVMAADKPIPGGILTLGMDTVPVGLDPHIATSFASRNFFEQCYETLLRYNDKLELEPCLATSWEQPNPLTYIFHIRRGVKFHDGSDFTAEDVKFTFERIKDPETKFTRGQTFQPIVKIETPDKYTAKFILSEPFPGLLNILGTQHYSAIVSQTAVKKHGTLQTLCIGTGPFKLVNYEHGVKASYVRFADYWEKGKPYLDGLELIMIADQSSRVAALRKETVDIAWVTDASQADLLVKEKHLNVLLSEPVRPVIMYLKNDRFPFNNMKLKQALSCAIDRQEIIDLVTLGKGKLATCIPPASIPYAYQEKEISTLPYYKQDLTLSKKLLKEAGYPDGFEFSLDVAPQSPDYIPAAEVIQGQLAKVGIRMKVVQMDWGALLKRRIGGDYTAGIIADIWSPDPDNYVSEYWHSGAPMGKTGGMTDKILDQLLDAQRKEANLDKRIDLWHKIQRHSAENPYAIFIYAVPGRYEIINKRVKDYKFIPNLSRIYLREAWIQK